jgi:general secretion pathway protein M
MLDRAIAHWHTLQARERLALMVAGVVVLAAVVFLAIVDPIISTRAALRDEVSALTADVRWMRDAAPRLGVGGRPTPSPSGDASVLSAVDASAQRAGLRPAVRRLQPEGNSSVRITLDDASFDAIVMMLGDLRERGVLVDRLALRHEASAEGLVDGSMSLRAAD